MNITNEKMDDKTPSNLKNTILLAIYSGLIIIAFFITIGFLIAHFSHEDHSMSVTGIAALCGLISTNILLAYAIIRTHKGRYKDPEVLTLREKLNCNILLFSGFIGIAISILLSVFGEGVGDNANAVLSNSPIPPILAIILAIFMLIIVPITLVFWEKKALMSKRLRPIEPAHFMRQMPISAWFRHGGYCGAADWCPNPME